MTIRKLGIITISGNNIRNCQKNLVPIFKTGLVPLQMEGNVFIDSVEIVCYHESFRELELGVKIPHYDVIYHEDENKEITVELKESQL